MSEVNGDELLERLDHIIRFIISQDLPELNKTFKHEQVVGHLTGAVLVTVMEVVKEDHDDPAGS